METPNTNRASSPENIVCGVQIQNLIVDVIQDRCSLARCLLGIRPRHKRYPFLRRQAAADASRIPIGAETRTMNPEQREKIYQLARLIQDEQDPAKFRALAEQLYGLLERKERRFIEEQKKDPLP